MTRYADAAPEPTAPPGDEPVRVIVASAVAGGPLWAGAGTIVSPRHASRTYHVAVRAPVHVHELARAMPRAVHSLLVLDERLGAQFSTEALAALHREFPGAEWLLCWERPTPHGVALVWQCRARGGVEWGQSPAQLAEAFDAVLDGELWFSTSVLQQLYLAGLGLHANHAEVHGELTSREAEVLALVRLGHTNKLIAQRLEISVNTVKKHLAHVFDKLGLHSRRQERP